MLKNGNITLVGEIRGLKPQRLAADPSGADLKEGLVWVNTTDKSLKWYDGAQVLTIATGGALDDYLAKDGGTMTGPLVLAGNATENLEAVPLQQVTNLLTGKEDSITGAASTITDTDLTVSRAVIADENGKIAVSAVTVAELAHLSGVTSPVQTQLDDKQDDLGYTPINKAGDSVSGNLNFGGTNTLKNLAAPVDPTDPVRLIDIDNLKADLDFQADVLAVQLDDTLVPTEDPLADAQVRYIVTDADNLNELFGTIAGLEDGDIIQRSGEDFVVAYDVSVKGPGALVWDRGNSKFMKYDGANWTEHGGLSGVTVSAGLIKSGNTISVAFGAGVANLPTGEVGIDVAVNKGLELVDPTTGDASTASDAVLGVKVGASLDVGAGGIIVKAAGVDATHLATSVAGLGIEGGAGTALTVKLDGTSLVKSADGLALGDISADYLKLDTASTITAQVAVPAPTADASIVNKLYADQGDQANADAISQLESNIDANQFVFDGTTGAAQDTYSINHNLGNKYAVVAVYDETDAQIIPDTVTLTDANNLEVTLAVAQKVRIVINGKKVAV